MPEKLTQAQTEEMKGFVDSRGELIHPSELVEFAEDPDTAMHSWFEWDDDKAAWEFRVNQARKALRSFKLVVINRPKAEPQMLSLSTDRRTGGGYRRVTDVAQRVDLRQVVIRDATQEVATLLKRLETLELAGGDPITDIIRTLERALADLRATIAA